MGNQIQRIKVRWEKKEKGSWRLCLSSPLCVGADHYRRAQHDARISAGASANNLILHTDCYFEGLLWYYTVGLKQGDSHRQKCDPRLKHRHGCAVGRRDVHQIPDVRLQPGVLGEFEGEENALFSRKAIHPALCFKCVYVCERGERSWRVCAFRVWAGYYSE